MLAKDQVAQLVDEVMRKLAERGALPAQAESDPPLPVQGLNPLGVYTSVDAAAQAARAAYQRLNLLPLARRKALIEAIRQAAMHEAAPLAEHAVRETGLGRAADKAGKNRLAAEKTPGVEDVVSVAWSGDQGLTLVELAPWGVVGSITPTTNPTSTVINNAISLVAAGNAVLFNFHPAAKACCVRTMETLNRAIVSAGGPESLLCAVAEPTIETSQQVMRHKGVDALLVTGGPGVVKEAMASGKKVWAAGPGNPPVVVDATADLDQAARDIVTGASFDNCVLCTGEKEVFVVGAVADQLKSLLERHGAYEVKWSEVGRLERVLFTDAPPSPSGRREVRKEWIGKDAALILKAAGITAPPGTRLAIAEVPREHPFIWTEMLLPVLGIVRVKDVDDAIDLAIKAEKGNRHTAIIHSHDIRNLSRFAREANTSIFVKNGPSLAGLGFGGEGFTTLSITGTTGEGLTSARTFTRQRRCALVGHFRII